jgi:hypothetical protein
MQSPLPSCFTGPVIFLQNILSTRPHPPPSQTKRDTLAAAQRVLEILDVHVDRMQKAQHAGEPPDVSSTAAASFEN